ncbi:MAG: hypothetical protein V4664_03580 [Patescibacteria group bacterium]
MAKSNRSSKGKGDQGIVVTGIIGIAAAAAAGAYFLYGTKDGKKMQKKVRGWSLKAKGEVLEKLENLKEVNEDAYHKTVDAVLKRYETVKSVDAAELASIAKELKGHWANIRKELEVKTKPVAKKKTNAKKSAK